MNNEMYTVLLNYAGIDFQDTVAADSEEEALRVASEGFASMMQMYGKAWPTEDETTE